MFDTGKVLAQLRQAQANPARAAALIDDAAQSIRLGSHPYTRGEPGRAGANLFVRPTDPGAVPNVGAGATTAGQAIRWRVGKNERARVLACYGQVTTASDVDMASISFQVLVGGDKSIITNGDANAYLPYLAAFGQTRNWLPLDREVVDSETWTVTWRNEGFTGAAISPSLVFAVLKYTI